MPDQSLDQQTNPTTGSEPTTMPGDTSANHPEAATPESVESNVSRASEGQTQQADVTINQDPQIGAGGVGTATGESYEDMNLDELRDELTHRKLPKSGNKPDLIQRLKDYDEANPPQGDSSENLGTETTDAEPAPDVPHAEVNPTNVDNGGIQRTDVAVEHSGILQGLSAERRQQQLEASRSTRQQPEAAEDTEDTEGQQAEQQTAPA